MKLGLTLQGINDTIKNLQVVGMVIEKDFTGELINNATRIRDRAKEILEGKTNPIYSTGKLKDSIKVNILDKNRITVGPDMRVAPYAEWVEIGHYMTGGWVKKGNIKGARRWKGYHYMEGAWLEVSPKIIPDIAKTISVKMNSFARSAKRTRHKTTGRFVEGWGGYD